MDQLPSLLPTLADSDRPWLVDYAGAGRVELTGHVLAMWAAKVTGFLREQAPQAPLVELSTAGSWRGLAWALGTWAAGGSVRSRQERLIAQAYGEQAAPADVSVALSPEDLDPEAELQVLLPSGPLALAWDGPAPLPPLVVDGVADLMAYPDQAPATDVSSDATALDVLAWAAQSAPAPGTNPLDDPERRQACLTPLSRGTVYDVACFDAGERAQDWTGWDTGEDGRPYPTTAQARSSRPRALLVRAEPLTAARPGCTSRDDGVAHPVPTAAGTTGTEASDGVISDVDVLQQVLDAWAGGQCAVVLPAGTSPQRRATIAAQEGARVPDAKENA